MNTSPRALLTDRSSIAGLDSASTTSYTARGNVTRSTNWILSIGTQLHTYPQYDIAGNVVRVTDARGYATQFDFSDNFGAPNGNATTPTAPSELNGQYTFAFVTKVTNPLNHLTFTQFDYHLGRPVDAQDANGIVSTGYSEYDFLDRPTKVIRAFGTGAQNQTLFGYDELNKIITTTSDLHANTDGILVTKLVYDAMGRTIETRQYEGGSNYVATQQQYDVLGRAYKVSNASRPWQSETAVWTETAFDALGRATTVTTPDNAVVTTAYSGNAVTVTDQAGKKRRSVTDALGRLVRVDEPNASGDLDVGGVPVQPTSYSYDVLENLTLVTQGSQTRTFVYDSLKRLTSATNPESGTVTYTYDNNNNLLTKTEARGVVSTYAYDGLNRNLTVVYTNDSSGTLPVTRTYDLATNGIGRVYKSETTGSSGSLTTIDAYDALGRPLTQRQQFYYGGGWSNSYTTQRTYNCASGVTSQTYPSGHVVNYNYDAAGRLGDKDASNLAFKGNLGDGILRTYAQGILYSAFGGISKEQFGTDTPIYNRSIYNSRGQLSEIRASTSSSYPAATDWNRGAILNQYSDQCNGPTCNGTDNNGNLKRQEVFIPHNDQISGYTNWLQQYDYDSLNRLQRVKEINSSNTTLWQQEYEQYDRWGNRKIHQSNTWGTGINKKDFTVSTSNNRLGVPSGQSGTMTYDSAGNLITDSYSGDGSRTYDAENRMISAQGGSQTHYYTYNADGQRVRRNVNGVDTWQVYGMDGELLAEYAANGSPTALQNEYGYRNGQLLVTVSGVNCGVGYQGTKSWGATNGALGHIVGHQEGSDWVGSVSSDSAGYFSFGPYDNSFGQGHHSASFLLQVDNTSGTDVVATLDVVTSYGGTVLVQRQLRRNEFTAANQSQWFPLEFDNPCFGLVEARIFWHDSVNFRFNQLTITGINSAGLAVNWLVADHLGTPRMIFDKTGSLTTVKRHDYLPFGEELSVDIGGRTTQNGYTSDNLRQKFTLKERDSETGLDYFLARYYSSPQGRFTSPDEFTGGPDELYYFADAASENPTFYADLTNPQSLNKYQYTYNNPLNMVDPDGHCPPEAAALCRAAPIVFTIPGLREAAVGAAAVVIIASVIDAIPGDKTAGDGSCPSCEAALKAGQQRMEQEETARQQQQNIFNQNISGGASGKNSNAEPEPVSKKEAVKQAHKEVGKQPKGKPGKFGSPTRGDSRKGYRLDPPNPRGKGREKTNRHINWWDYSKGKRKSGSGRKGYIPIEDDKK